MPPATAALAKLQITHVCCREGHLLCQVEQAVPVFVPRQVAPHMLRCFLRGEEPPAGGYHSVLQQHRRQIDKPGAAQPGSFSAANHVEHEAAVIDRMAHRPRDAGHAAAYARALERRPRGHGAAEDAAAAAERHLAVRAYIEKQPLPGALRHSNGE